MSKDQNAQDPLEFVRGMWNQMGFSLPGMVTPTLDVDELEKRIKLLFPKKQARWIAKNIVCVIDHRDNSRRYVAQGRCILEVKYTINGVDL